MERSIRNPLSFVELSDHARDIRPAAGLADRFVGAAGTRVPETLIVVCADAEPVLPVHVIWYVVVPLGVTDTEPEVAVLEVHEALHEFVFDDVHVSVDA